VEEGREGGREGGRNVGLSSQTIWDILLVLSSSPILLFPLLSTKENVKKFQFQFMDATEREIFVPPAPQEVTRAANPVCPKNARFAFCAVEPVRGKGGRAGKEGRSTWQKRESRTYSF